MITFATRKKKDTNHTQLTTKVMMNLRKKIVQPPFLKKGDKVALEPKLFK